MANDLNQVILVGRLVRDMELSYMQSSTAIGTFSIAVGRSYKDSNGQKVDDVSFFDVKLFGKPAESLKQYLTKGKQIAVQGSLKQDRWEKDGKNYSKINIVSSVVQLLGGTTKAGSPYNRNGTAEETPQGVYEEDGFPEDIPF